MKVQFTYTVDEEEVLSEASKLLGLKAPALQEVIDIFTRIQTELQQTDEAVNTPQVLEDLQEFRTRLVGLDLRAAEVSQIVTGYARHQEATPTNGSEKEDTPVEE